MGGSRKRKSWWKRKEQGRRRRGEKQSQKQEDDGERRRLSSARRHPLGSWGAIAAAGAGQLPRLSSAAAGSVHHVLAVADAYTLIFTVQPSPPPPILLLLMQTRYRLSMWCHSLRQPLSSSCLRPRSALPHSSCGTKALRHASLSGRRGVAMASFNAFITVKRAVGLRLQESISSAHELSLIHI